MWRICAYTDDMRARVCDTADALVGRMAGAADAGWWRGLTEGERIEHIVSSRCVMDTVTEVALRRAAVPLLLAGFDSALGPVRVANAGFYTSVCELAA